MKFKDLVHVVLDVDNVDIVTSLDWNNVCNTTYYQEHEHWKALEEP